MAYILQHLSGDDACGKDALEWIGKNKPNSGELIRSSDFRHLDGSAVKPLSHITCDSCNQTLFLSTSDIIWR